MAGSGARVLNHSMKIEPLLGVNLYCFRDDCRTEADLDRTLGRLRERGFPSVQVSGIGPIAPAAVRALLDKHGLTACAAHESYEALASPLAVADKLETLGCGFTALGYPGDERFARARWPELAETLQTAGRVLASRGLRLGYHNHANEFEDQGGTNLLTWLYENTAAETVYAELDTAWIQHGGGSPEAWIRKLAGRVPAIHLKDYTWTKAGVRLCEVGHGNLDWTGILKACVETKIPVWIIEQDHPVAGRDLFASTALSLKTIQDFLKEANR